MGEWKCIGEYLYQYSAQDSENFEICLTNIDNIWKNKFDSKFIQEKLEGINQVFDMSKEDLLQLIANSFLDCQDIYIRYPNTDELKSIAINKKIGIAKFRYQRCL